MSLLASVWFCGPRSLRRCIFSRQPIRLEEILHGLLSAPALTPRMPPCAPPPAAFRRRRSSVAPRCAPRAWWGASRPVNPAVAGRAGTRSPFLSSADVWPGSLCGPRVTHGAGAEQGRAVTPWSQSARSSPEANFSRGAAALELAMAPPAA